MSHTRNVVISASTKLIVVALIPECVASNWRSGINWWSILFSSVLVFVCVYVFVCDSIHTLRIGASEWASKFLRSFQSKTPKNNVLNIFGICVLVKRSSSAFCFNHEIVHIMCTLHTHLMMETTHREYYLLGIDFKLEVNLFVIFTVNTRLARMSAVSSMAQTM